MTVVQKKVCMLGDFAVGKTSLVRRFVQGIFDDKYLTTVGVKISQKTVKHQTSQIKMILWDLSGGSEFERILPSYLRGAAAALLVCDLTRSDTLKHTKEHVRRIKEINPESVLVLAANKSDLTEERRVELSELESVAKELSISYFLTSAKTGDNVEALFNTLAAGLSK